MTYCVALRMNRGLAFLSDTRTNAGVDDVSTFKKMSHWEVPGERMITLMSAGNLATTQSVVNQLDERTKTPEERDPSILRAPTMFQVASIIGETLKHTITGAVSLSGLASGTFGASLIVGGQIAGQAPRLFLIYAEGNFIEAMDDTPFVQIGETKYGRPILVRAFNPDMSFEDAAKLLLVSMDSTVRANLSVGLPLDLQLYEADSLTTGRRYRITGDDPYYQTISQGWGDSLRTAFNQLPPFQANGGPVNGQ